MTVGPYVAISIVVLNICRGHCEIFRQHLPVAHGAMVAVTADINISHLPGMSSSPSAAVRIQFSQIALHVFGFLDTSLKGVE